MLCHPPRTKMQDLQLNCNSLLIVDRVTRLDHDAMAQTRYKDAVFQHGFSNFVSNCTDVVYNSHTCIASRARLKPLHVHVVRSP